MSEKLQDPKYAFVAGGVMNRASGEIIPHDEPVFIFRARDRQASRTLRYYATTIGRSPDDHWEAVMARVEDFERFAREHPERMKEPDTGPAARAEARPAPVVDREAVAGPAYTSVGYQYRFSDPMSGHPVWRTSSAQWNGQRPQETREIFALLSPAVDREAVARWFAARRAADTDQGDPKVMPWDRDDADAILALLSPATSPGEGSSGGRVQAAPDGATERRGPYWINGKLFSQDAGDRWHHIKRGTTYTRPFGAAEAMLQTSEPIEDGAVLTIYVGSDGMIFARPTHEFHDGRFLPIPTERDDGSPAEGRAGTPATDEPTPTPDDAGGGG